MTQRYLLQIRMENEQTFTKTFNTYEDMKEFIKARDFYFVHCDYSTYDIAIKLKTA